ncbi:hypothetical protein K469DRAFT_755088 [Zopfia rhizophila CBS 207.26]|uniref:Uncharacterized protein n=1 Tax=Zopfia rhizophila CBS 207.26 TaxID=1314779 RepID=A0A6A6DI05_9PEZI|nr:hypothetical protein K469DRAFT_755088 [Zopfia rhizophila CBS 207.26]
MMEMEVVESLAKLRLEVVEPVECLKTLAELVVLSRVSDMSRDVVEKAFSTWLSVQPVGVPLEVGSLDAELQFVRDHVGVLVAQKVSVTCEVREDGVSWWLTKESGRLPLRCGYESYRVCCFLGSEWVTRVKPVSYLVVKMSDVKCSSYVQDVQRYQVRFTLLSIERLDKWRQEMLWQVVRCVQEGVDCDGSCVERDVVCGGTLSLVLDMMWLGGGRSELWEFVWEFVLEFEGRFPSDYNP